MTSSSSPPSFMSAPLVELEGARIECAGAVTDALDARGGLSRVVLVGRSRPFFRLLAREATLVAGRARVAGEDARQAVGKGVAGVALFDPPLPKEWTAERYLFESARLMGLKRADAERAAGAAIARLELAQSARQRLGDLVLAVRRVVLLAHASLGSVAVVCAEAPLAGLDPGSQGYVAAALERLAATQRLIVSVAAPVGLEQELVARADWVIVTEHERFVRQGPPAGLFGRAARYTATVTRAAEAFVAELAACGASPVRAALAPGLLGFLPKAGMNAERIVIDLPEGLGPDDVVLAAHRAGAPLIELAPFA